MFTNKAGSADLLITVLRYLFQFLRWILNSVGLSVLGLLLKSGQAADPKSSLHGFQVSEVPAFQFSANNTNQYIRLARQNANVFEYLLDRLAFTFVLIPKNNEMRIGRPPAFQF